MHDRVLIRWVVLIVVSVSSLIALATIGAAILHPYYSTTQTPSILENWGGLIIGFYFGTFATMLKEWLTGKQKEDEDDADKVHAGHGRSHVVATGSTGGEKRHDAPAASVSRSA